MQSSQAGVKEIISDAHARCRAGVLLRRTYNVFMEIELIGFGEASKLLLPLARATVTAVRARMPSTPPLGERPIRCYFTPDRCPQVITEAPGYRVTSSDHYRINIGSDNSYSGQFIYQLAHEMGHVMFDPRRTNGVLEIFAVAISLQIIEDIANIWQQTPPQGLNASNSSVLHSYRNQVIKHELSRYNAEALSKVFADFDLVELANYARAHIEEQDKTPGHALLNLAGALPLLPTMPWDDLVGIAKHTDPSPDVENAYRVLPLRLSTLPITVQEALRRIGR
jgi:hypothetical protein